MEEHGVGRALARSVVDSIRQWIAAIGMTCAVIGAASAIYLMTEDGTNAAFLGALGLLLAGVPCGVVGLRSRRWMGWLMAAASVALSLIAFALFQHRP